MKAKALHRSILAYTKDLAKYTKETGTKFDPGTIHELRTSFKKMRALLRWQKKDKKIYSVFKKVYAHAGEIRNIQVAKNMLKNKKTTPQVFKNWSTFVLVDLKEKWDKEANEKRSKQLLKNIEHLKIQFTKHRNFFLKKIQNIQQIISIDPVPDSSMHDIRKMTKDMLYILTWWKKKGGPGSIIKNISISWLKDITRQLGEYNDKRILITLLKAYTQQEKEPALIAQIDPLIDKWLKEKILQKEKIMIEFHKRIYFLNEAGHTIPT